MVTAVKKVVKQTAKKAATTVKKAVKQVKKTVTTTVKSATKTVSKAAAKTYQKAKTAVTDKGTASSPRAPPTKILDSVQTGLDIAGLVPGVGEIADGTNALIYTLRGDKTNAALSATACIKIVNKGVKALGKADKVYDAAKGAGDVFSKKPIVIGENMQRVKQYADEIGGHAYKPWKNDPFDFDLGMKRNQRWINDMKKEGREIIDIGPDFSRRSFGTEPSSFYNMERTQLKGYENYQKVFERDGRLSGGVLGLDW